MVPVDEWYPIAKKFNFMSSIVQSSSVTCTTGIKTGDAVHSLDVSGIVLTKGNPRSCFFSGRFFLIVRLITSKYVPIMFSFLICSSRVMHFSSLVKS